MRTLEQPKTVVLPFEEQATSVLRRLRGAVSAVIEAVPGSGSISKAADLQRALNIRSTLAWQVYRLAYAAGPVVEASAIPGVTAMNHFFEAASARQVPNDVIIRARRAVEEFKAVVQAHAGDRSAFDSMISALDGSRSTHIDLQHKRAAYKANSHLWGVRAKTQLSCFMHQPSADNPDMIDLVGIRGMIGLRRLRRNAPWVISRVRLSDADGRVQERHQIERGSPIDPIEDGAPAVSLLRDFCSKPLPKFSVAPGGEGLVNVELQPTSVGDQSAVTCLIGDAYRSVFSLHSTPETPEHTMQTIVRTPCETLIHDVLLYHGMFPEQLPQVCVYSDLRAVTTTLLGRERDLLPMSETVIYLGRGPQVLSTPDVPRYAEMVQYALDRVGWDASKFDVYRCRVEYPIMPSSVVTIVEPPKRPGGGD
jgi:hypothetical protein